MGGGIQKILSDFGIQYVTLVFNRAKIYSRPQSEKIAWENNVLLVDRGESEIPWNTIASPPYFKFDRPVMALHWANILHRDPEKNMRVVDNWIRYISENRKKKGILLARDTRSCFTQYLHRTFSRVEQMDAEVSIDVSWMKNVPANLTGQTLFLKLDGPPGRRVKIAGAQTVPLTRPAETPFLKLRIPPGTNKIWLKPLR
jgi:hypothetical protein